MTAQKSLKLNAIMNAILTATQVLFPLITVPYVSKILLPVGSGKVSFATSLITYFTMFAQLGIPSYGIRACAKVRDDKEALSKTVQELLIINLVTATISYISLFFSLKFVDRLQDEKLLYSLMSVTILFSALGVEWLFSAIEEYTYVTVKSILFNCIQIGFLFLLVKKQSDYLKYGCIHAFANSLSYILNFIVARKFVTFKPFKNYNFKQHLKPILVLFAMACATIIYTNLDTVMLGFMKTDADVGYYNIAIKFKLVLVSVVTSLGAVLFPRVSYYLENKQLDEFKKIINKAINVVLILSLALIAYFVLFAQESVLFISTEEFRPSILPMQILMPTLLLIGITQVLGYEILIPQGKEIVVLQSSIVGAVADIIINALLIPKYASIGAAIGTLVAEILVFIVQAIYVRNTISESFKSVNYLRLLVGIALGLVACCWVKQLDITYFLKLVISAVIYFGVYFGFLLITKEPMVKEVFDSCLGKIKKVLNV